MLLSTILKSLLVVLHILPPTPTHTHPTCESLHDREARWEREAYPAIPPFFVEFNPPNITPQQQSTWSNNFWYTVKLMSPIAMVVIAGRCLPEGVVGPVQEGVRDW